jgi:lipopolysaccharide/colanic/teichoic acid biosynthesis glycosyltransferase
MRYCYLFLKRLFDIGCSLLGLIVSAPFWLIAAVGIKLSDPGPIFYIANRLGRGNRNFRMYKFRSMRVGKANEALLRGEEIRIFPFGQFMRDAKIDELPPLLNILKGDMSIVGPRPAAVDQVEITRGGRFAAAGEVTSGLTGPSALYDYLYGDQIESEEEYLRDVLPTRLELDLVYLDKRGVFFDLRMIWWTVVCIVYRLAGRVPEHIFNTLLKWAAEHRKVPVCAAN